MKVGFAGMTYLGINYGAVTASKRFDTVCYDSDPSLIDRLAKGQLPIEEPGLLELIHKSHRRLTFSSSVEALGTCDLVFFSLDVRTADDNTSDVAPLLALLQDTLPHLREDAVIVILSQVQPGFTRKFFTEIAQHGKLTSRQIFYQVETLVSGRAVERATKPDRFIVGAADPKEPLPFAFTAWHTVFKCPVLIMKYESAELAKISINLFLAASVTTANTVAEICERIGADWSEIVPALHLDSRIGPAAYLKPGLGIAGGNLERDIISVKDLANRYKTDSGIMDAWLKNSQYRKSWPHRTLAETFGEKLDGLPIAVWGLAYKENTDSIKNSPSIEFLKSVPRCIVRAFDPQVKLENGFLPHVERVTDEMDACGGAEVLLILTPWPQFSKINLADVRARMTGNLVLDPYAVTSRSTWESLGVRCLQLGSPKTV